MILKMQNSKKSSIIIVNYRSEQYLEKCIASIYNWSNPDFFEIIVVNNDQECDLSKVAEKYDEVSVFDSKKNIGFGAACNLGAKSANGELLLFLNPDTQFLSDYVSELLKEFANNTENIGIIGPRLITDDGKTQEWCAGKTITPWQIIKNNLGIIENKKIWESQKNIFTDWVSGAALAIKRDVFEKIGGFDKNFFMYFEDDDLCRRVRRLDYKICYFPTISVLHSGGKSYGNVFRQKAQFYKSLAYYMMKRVKGF